MKIVDRGILNCGKSGGRRAYSTFPSAAWMPDGTLLASYRAGSAKDSDDGTIEFRRSNDGGYTWGEAETPFDTDFEGRHGSLWLAYATTISAERVILAALWVDREAHPGCPLFNAETEGCLPMKVLLSDSADSGRTWSEWRQMPVSADVGPPSLTNPILKMRDGRLAASIESNKHYHDRSPWKQRVVYVASVDEGRSWSTPFEVVSDPDGRIFHWDQRAGVGADGRVVTFTWTYDRQTGQYLNIQRRSSSNCGQSWTEPDDLGFGDQASHPAMMSNGRIVLAWVDRFESNTIRARMAESLDAPFRRKTEVVLYDHNELGKSSNGSLAMNAGELLDDMSRWSYGLPFSLACEDGQALVFYYAPDEAGTRIEWARLAA